MRDLLLRSLPSPIPDSPGRSSGSPCSSFWGVLRRSGPGRLCCSSKRSLDLWHRKHMLVHIPALQEPLLVWGDDRFQVVPQSYF